MSESDELLANLRAVEASRDAPLFDALGRTPIATGMKARIDAVFASVPEGKRGALLVIADEQGGRAHLAARIGDTWKVAAGAAIPWDTPQPSGWIGFAGVW